MFKLNNKEHIQMLAKQGLSLREIARETGISYSTVHSWAKQYSKLHSKIDFASLNDLELGYITGFLLVMEARYMKREQVIMVSNLRLML